MPKRDLVKRIDLHNTGLFGDGSLTSGRTPQKYWGSVLVAAYNSSPEERAGADYVCDGVDDHEEINSAITSGGSSPKRVVLSSGDFKPAGNINFVSGITLEGQGANTVVRSNTGVTILFNVDTVDRVQIKNLKIISVAFTNLCVYITSANDVLVENVTFQSVIFLSCVDVTGPAKRIAVRNCRFIDYTVTFACINVFADTGLITEQLTIADNMFYGSTVSNPHAIALEAWDDGTGTIPAFASIYLRNVVVSGNVFKGRASVTLASRGNFLNATIVDSLVVTGNSIDNANIGVSIGDCPNATIADNSFSTVHTGISASSAYYDSDNAAGRYYTITSNTIRNSIYAIYLTGPVTSASYLPANVRSAEDYRIYATVSGNQVYAATEGINLITCAQVAVTGNVVTTGNPTGIYISQSWNITVTGNTVSDCTEHGVEIIESYNVTVDSNMLSRNTSSGVRLIKVLGIAINDNYFIDNGNFIDDLYNGDIRIDELGGLSGSDQILIRGNTFKIGYLSNINAGVIYIIDPLCSNLLIEKNYGCELLIHPDVLSNVSAVVTYRYADNITLDGALIKGPVALEPGTLANTSVVAFPNNPQPPPHATSFLVANALTMRGHTSYIALPQNEGGAPHNVTSIVTDAEQNRIFIFKSAYGNTMVHGGNIHLAAGANFTFGTTYALLTMLYDGTNFLEIARSANT